MASARQKAANRKNSQKSTGPKSKAGRKRSAQNALRHGLSNQKPDPALSLSFYRCILQDLLATPQQAYTNPIKASALALAHCEAILLKAQNALTAHDQQIAVHMARISKDGMDTEREAALAQALAVLGIPATFAKEPDHWIFDHVRIVGDLSILEPLRPALLERRKLSRYRREAEAARRKALHSWLAAGEIAAFNWTGSDEQTYEPEFTAAELGL